MKYAIMVQMTTGRALPVVFPDEMPIASIVMGCRAAGCELRSSGFCKVDGKGGYIVTKQMHSETSQHTKPLDFDQELLNLFLRDGLAGEELHETTAYLKLCKGYRDWRAG